MNELERVLLVGVNSNQYSSDQEFIYTMEELENLAVSCELEVKDVVTQNLSQIVAATYIGSGKLIEIKQYVLSDEIDTVVFNDELTPTQLRNIQEEIPCKVIDRTTLILDIFARRAKTKEAILQVEIAQLRYLLPRLSSLHDDFSRQEGRIGSRGPGEKKIELSRRRIESQIDFLNKKLKEIAEKRKIQRSLRKRNKIPVVALVGYTNAGKSTVLNSLIGYSKNEEEKLVFSHNMLFATLETTTRKIILENNKRFLVTDTVGFVSKLPHHLIKAFRSTLEEVIEADLILHVIDSSNSNHTKQEQVTNQVLTELGVKDTPVVKVYNKIDQAENDIVSSEGIHISAKKNINIDSLISLLETHLFEHYRKINMLIPYTEGQVFNVLKEQATLIDYSYEDNGIKVYVEADEQLLGKYNDFVI
ncbi:GTPase HflX [Haloplasma contractile]|uniref:GTPase HflX n=1 Tax=Haloplasma contractile SSD-17B TaxID=1033810 RepID=U2FMN0_9MOLU|nr:GTPase HflX [Haloplasma contractile]ERJ12409.1 GTPase HflX protein [Haloplasma contractile SSD-17B]